MTNETEVVVLKPPGNDAMPGKYFVQPIDQWHENGTLKAASVHWDLVFFSVEVNGRTYGIPHWGNPKLINSDIGFIDG